MKKLGFFLILSAMFSLTGCSTCDPRFQHCGGQDVQMQQEIADEVGQML